MTRTGAKFLGWSKTQVNDIISRANAPAALMSPNDIYTITEESATGGVEKSNETLYLDVYVVNDNGGLTVSNCFLHEGTQVVPKETTTPQTSKRDALQILTVHTTYHFQKALREIWEIKAKASDLLWI